MKNAILELQKDINKHSIIESPLLKSILSMFNINTQENTDLDVIPGSSYAYAPEGVKQEDLNAMFNIIISTDELMTNNEDISSQIIAHIASFSFEYFVNNLAPNLFTKRSLPLQYVASKVSRIIVDPATGFLKNSPQSPLNDEWNDKEYNFDFFSAENSDRHTRFGKSLDKFRQMIFDQLKDFLTDENLIKKDLPKLSVFVPSLFVSVQTTVIPPSFRIVDIACGFPLRTEILLSYSKFQDQSFYSKTHDLNFQNSEIANEWSIAFWSLFEESPTKCPSDITIFDGVDCSKNVQMRFAKLILFLNLGVSVQVTDEVFHKTMKFILGSQLSLSAFYIMLSQELLLVYPEFSFPLFDDIFEIIDNKVNLSKEQLFTFMLSITRFVDVLSLLPTRYLEDSQIEKLLCFTIIGLCSNDIGIRYISFKVIRSLGNFESDNKFLNLHKFIIDNSSYFEQSFFYAYESHPHSILSQSNLQVLTPIKFKESLLSTDYFLWQTALSSLGVFISHQFPKEFCEMIKKNAYDISNQQNDIHDVKYILTLLSPLCKIPYENEGSSENIDNDSILLTESIIIKLIQTTKENVANSSLSQLYTMISTLNISSFYLCLDLLTDTIEPKTIIVFLYSIIWNPEFVSVAEDTEFFEKFIDLFLRVCDSFASIDKELMETTLDELISHHHAIIIDENTFLSSILSCFYQILNILQLNNSTSFNAPFPCTNFVVNTDDPLIVKTRKLFPFVYNLANADLPDSYIHKYAIKTLEMWFACNSLNEISLLCSEYFLKRLPKYGKEAHSLLTHLLSHHFDVLFLTYLENALQPNGEIFFEAISAFFRAVSLSPDTLPLDILKMQWSECMNNYDEESENKTVSEYLRTIYKNCGTFILCCLLYLILPNTELNDEAFITLSSITPILLLFHTNGRKDTVTPLIETIISICDHIGQSLSCFDSQTIYQLSKSICEHFQFCMEQLMYSLLTNLPKFDKIIIDRTLSAMLPWFASIQFDIENRVISRETDLMFIRFSCFSFVEMLMNAFSEIASDDINSPLFRVWKTLANDESENNSNFLLITISVLNLASSNNYHKAAYIIIRFMYHISPKITDILSTYLSFSFSANYSYLESLNDYQISDLNSGFSTPWLEDDESLMNLKKGDSSIIDFILKILEQLVHESVKPLMPYLPIIFSYCVVNLDLHFKLIRKLIISILTELQPFIENSSVPYLQEVLRMVSSLPSFYNSATASSSEEIYRSETQLEQSIPRTSRTEISRAITHFFQSLSNEYATNFGFEILKWSLCCSDLYRASYGMICYRGNLMQTNSLLIGLISRSIWTSFDAITYLYNSGKDRTSIIMYARYISECYKTLHSLASLLMQNGTIGSYPMLLWIAIAGSSCNVTCVSSIFDASLPLLNDLLHPALFGYLNGKHDFLSIHYSESTFTKYHKPWGDSFHGCAEYILRYNGPNPDIDKMISILNNLVQDCYPLVFSESETWAYLALLTLLPWMWSVIITDINRFFFWSTAVQTLEATSGAFAQFIQDQVVKDFLAVLMSDEKIDVFSEIEKVCSFIIPLIPLNELALAANFFTNCLEYGAKTLRMPLYSVATHILSKSNEKCQIAFELNRFTEIIKRDVKTSRKTYIKMYFDALNQANETCKVIINFDEHFNEKNHLNQIGSPSQNDMSDFSSFYEAGSFNESSQLNMAEFDSGSISMSLSTGLIESEQESNTGEKPKKKKKKIFNDIQLYGPFDPKEFPSLPIFERIVAVEIPHLYDFTATEAQAITFNELNSFPPLFPLDHNLFQYEKFLQLRATVKLIRCEPFCTWSEILAKLHTSLIDSDNLKKFYRVIKDKNFGQVIIEIVGELKNDQKETEEINADQTEMSPNQLIDAEGDQADVQQNEEFDQLIESDYQNEQIQLPIFDTDPFTLVCLPPSMFIPSIDQANLIGSDAFGEDVV